MTSHQIVTEAYFYQAIIPLRYFTPPNEILESYRKDRGDIVQIEYDINSSELFLSFKFICTEKCQEQYRIFWMEKYGIGQTDPLLYYATEQLRTGFQGVLYPSGYLRVKFQISGPTERKDVLVKLIHRFMDEELYYHFREILQEENEIYSEDVDYAFHCCQNKETPNQLVLEICKIIRDIEQEKQEELIDRVSRYKRKFKASNFRCVYENLELCEARQDITEFINRYLISMEKQIQILIRVNHDLEISIWKHTIDDARNAAIHAELWLKNITSINELISKQISISGINITLMTFISSEFITFIFLPISDIVKLISSIILISSIFILSYLWIAPPIYSEILLKLRKYKKVSSYL